MPTSTRYFAQKKYKLQLKKQDPLLRDLFRDHSLLWHLDCEALVSLKQKRTYWFFCLLMSLVCRVIFFCWIYTYLVPSITITKKTWSGPPLQILQKPLKLSYFLLQKKVLNKTICALVYSIWLKPDYNHWIETYNFPSMLILRLEVNIHK